MANIHLTANILITCLQVLCYAGSFVASVLVAIDHHKKIKWKKRQEKDGR